MIIGAHISREKTIIETMTQIKANNGNALQLFLTNPRSLQISDNSKYIKESHLIKKFCNINKFSLVVHGPYVINLAKPFINGKKSIDIKDTLVIHDITTANYIGALAYVLHVGKYTTSKPENAIETMRINIKNIINEIESRNIKTKLLLETPAGQGTELLTDFNQYLDFYYSFTEKERESFKLCIDTCHVWNCGYELNEISRMVKNKEDIICIHLNNSITNKGARLDRHETLFNGKINPNDLKDFAKAFEKSIIILEKPSDEYKKEIDYVK
jgi:deoxyribonuclease-4